MPAPGIVRKPQPVRFSGGEQMRHAQLAADQVQPRAQASETQDQQDNTRHSAPAGSCGGKQRTPISRPAGSVLRRWRNRPEAADLGGMQHPDLAAPRRSTFRCLRGWAAPAEDRMSQDDPWGAMQSGQGCCRLEIFADDLDRVSRGTKARPCSVHVFCVLQGIDWCRRSL